MQISSDQDNPESEVAGKHLRSGVWQEDGYVTCTVLELKSTLSN